VTDVERRKRHSTPRLARGLTWLRWTGAILAFVAVCSATVAVSSRPASASNIANQKAKAATLLSQIQRINSRVGLLGQRYDEALVKLHRLNHEIANTKNVVAQIERSVAKGNNQLRVDAIFAYVTNGAAQSTNPLFTNNASQIGSTNVYNELAQGNINTTLAGLKNYRLHLNSERALLKNQDGQAAATARQAASAFHDAKLLDASLQRALNEAKGQIANFLRQAQAAQNAQSAGILHGAQPVVGFPAPPPNPRAAIAIKTALSFIGVPYVWGGASRSGVDCSGLIMLAYAAAGIFFPHYSGAQFADTVRVPLIDLQPGDLLFYGYNGDEHVSMYLGHGEMIEAPYTGAVVHITPVRLGYGFVGAGRPRA